MTQEQINKLANLYEIDDSLWLEKTIQLLKKNKLDNLDLEHYQ